jgi:hypothetical protein
VDPRGGLIGFSQLGSRVSGPFAGLSVGITIVAALGVVVWITSLERQPGWSGLLVAVAVFDAVTTTLTFLKGWRRPRLLVAAAGVVVIALGSGVGRPRTADQRCLEACGPPFPSEMSRGEIVGVLDTWWPVVILGMMLLFAVVAHAFAAWLGTRGTVDLTGVEETAGEGLLGGALALTALGVGLVAIAFVLREIQLGRWIA